MDKQPFYLTKRRLTSGKSIYYFYYYDVYGQRTCPKSTGKSRKADALNYVVTLLQKHNLENNKTKFKVYADGFFNPDSAWSKDKAISGQVKIGTIKGYQSYFNTHILPYFSEMYIDKISPAIVKEFRIYLSEEKDLSNKSINNIIGTLRIIFNNAMENDIIQKNPCSFVKKLQEDNNREAYTYDEVLRILKSKWTNHKAFVFTLLASITGMRFSEILGLQPKQIHDTYIDINQQYYNDEITTVKTVERFTTIPKKLSDYLLKLGEGKEFIFESEDNLYKPISRSVMVRNLYSHFDDKLLEDKDKRQLLFHSFRYFVNTYYLSKGIISQKVDFMIGHSEKSGFMQRLYTTWKPELYTDVLEVQELLLDSILDNNVNLSLI